MAPRLFSVHSLTGVIPVLVIDFIILAAFLFAVMKLMPDSQMDIIELCNKYLGRGAGVFIAFCGAALFLLKFMYQSRICSSLISNNAYDSVSPWFYNVLFYIGIIIIVYMGLETITRLGSLFLPISFGIIAVLALMSAKNFNPYYLFPLLGHGAKSILGDVAVSLNCFSDLFVILLLLPYLRKKRFLSSTVKISFAVIVVLTALIVILYSGMSPGTTRSSFISPLGALIKLAKVFGHVLMPDMILLFLWNIFAVLYMCALLFFSALCLRKAFSLGDYRPMLLPLGVSLFSVSLFREDHPFVGFIYYYSHIICEVLGFLLPILLLIIIAVKQKRKAAVCA